jgi:hypothetical protein
MPDERLAAWLFGRIAGSRDGAMRGLLSALWSFLQHPAAAFGDHLTALEERLSALEGRLIGDLQTALDRGVVAVEDSVAGAEHRLESDFKKAIQSRIAVVQVRLDTIRNRVVEDLKRELRRVALVLALLMSCAVLALLVVTFGLMAAWMSLAGLIGAIGASLVLTLLFLLSGVIVFRLLYSVLYHTQLPPGSRSTAT